MKKSYNSTFKAKVALEALKDNKTMAELGSEYGVHPDLIRRWRNYLKEKIVDIFSDKSQKSQFDAEDLQAQRYQQIGQLKVELDWLKKAGLAFVHLRKH